MMPQVKKYKRCSLCLVSWIEICLNSIFVRYDKGNGFFFEPICVIWLCKPLCAGEEAEAGCSFLLAFTCARGGTRAQLLLRRNLLVLRQRWHLAPLARRRLAPVLLAASAPVRYKTRSFSCNFSALSHSCDYFLSLMSSEVQANR